MLNPYKSILCYKMSKKKVKNNLVTNIPFIHTLNDHYNDLTKKIVNVLTKKVIILNVKIIEYIHTYLNAFNLIKQLYKCFPIKNFS
jgi:hypothetical protein